MIEQEDLNSMVTFVDQYTSDYEECIGSSRQTNLLRLAQWYILVLSEVSQLGESARESM